MLVTPQTLYHLERLAGMEGRRQLGRVVDKLAREKMLALGRSGARETGKARPGRGGLAAGMAFPSSSSTRIQPEAGGAGGNAGASHRVYYTVENPDGSTSEKYYDVVTWRPGRESQAWPGPPAARWPTGTRRHKKAAPSGAAGSQLESL